MKRPVLLIIEDEDHVRRSLAELGLHLGFAVRTASNGEEALRAIDAEVPAVIVSDLHMPQLGGRQLLAILRRDARTMRTPVVVVTADNRRSTRIDLLEAGADDFLNKPVDPDEFRSRLRAMARRSDIVDQLAVVTRERDSVMEELAARNAELERLTHGLVVALERANSFNDSDTGNHIRRVCEYAGMLAEVRGCDRTFVDQLRRYAGLHDVGKVGIRDAILKKPGKLTADEFAEMQNHTLIGGELLRASGLPQVASNIALFHHERWDGSGYPHGLAGEAIPLEARIVAVTDVFDALVSERCYKRAFSYDEAVAEMRRSAGSHLDPNLVELFFSHSDRIRAIGSRYVDEVLPQHAWA